MTTLPWQACDSFTGNRTNEALTAHRPCPVCGADAPQEFLRRPGFQFFTDSAVLPKRTDVTEAQCGSCYALYLNPAYTAWGFEVLFAEAGCSYGATEGRPLEQIRWLTEHGLLAPGRSVLDVGCHDGRFLAQMPDHVRRLGIDIDAPAIERGRRQFGNLSMQLIHGDFDRFALDSPPDTITLYHVLEHLPKPVDTLLHLKRQSGPQTHLVVEVPIIENGFTNDINSFFSVQHMTHFSRRSLANTLARAGWVIKEQLEQPDYNGCRLLCRPAVPAPTVSGDPGDGTVLTRILDHISTVTAAVQQQLRALEGASSIVIWGGGMHTEFLYHYTDLFRDPARRFIIVDNDPLKQDKSWRGIAILHPASLAAVDWSETRLVPSSYAGTAGIARAARERGVPQERILSLYDSFRIY